MNEPSIKYSVKKYRKQKPYECLANSLCSIFEKQLDLTYGIDAEFDASELDDKVRKFYKMGEGEGSKLKFLKYMRRYGAFDKKGGKQYFVRSFFRGMKNPVAVRDLLCHKGPIALSFKTWTKWKNRKFNENKQVIVPSGFKQYGSHAVVIVGWDKDLGFEILDSHYDFTYFMSEQDYRQVVKSIYYLIV